MSADNLATQSIIAAYVCLPVATLFDEQFATMLPLLHHKVITINLISNMYNDLLLIYAKTDLKPC